MIREFALWPDRGPVAKKTVMFITYRRTVGVFALLKFAVVALAATAVAVVIGTIVLAVALAVATVARLARLVRPAWWWQHKVPAAPSWPHETFDATVVNPTALSGEDDLVRLDSDRVNRARQR